MSAKFWAPPPARRRKIGFSGHFTKKTILDAYQNGLDESQFCNKMSSFMIKVTLNLKKKSKNIFFCCWQGVTPFLLTCPQLICLFFIDAFPYLFLYSTADFIKKVLSVYTHSMTTLYLSLSVQVANSTFFMKSTVA